MHHSCALTIFSVGYTFPKTMIQPLKNTGFECEFDIKECRSNLGMSAGDPENSDANTPRTLLFGLNMTL